MRKIIVGSFTDKGVSRVAVSDLSWQWFEKEKQKEKGLVGSREFLIVGSGQLAEMEKEKEKGLVGSRESGKRNRNRKRKD
jgi:hypothetical protein